MYVCLYNLVIILCLFMLYLLKCQLQMADAMDNLEELLRLSGGDGQIFTMDGPLCLKSVQAMFG